MDKPRYTRIELLRDCALVAFMVVTILVWLKAPDKAAFRKELDTRKAVYEAAAIEFRDFMGDGKRFTREQGSLVCADIRALAKHVGYTDTLTCLVVLPEAAE